ncbi:MAG: uncharacterized protein A8A55_0583 [Amphiamblys sp. WSBS2006]|nr:MAG: uncharacterized protein A8A55_0583 [Amphiamblys sp. WSBS2006]
MGAREKEEDRVAVVFPKELYAHILFPDSRGSTRFLYGARKKERRGYVSDVRGSVIVRDSDEFAAHLTGLLIDGGENVFIGLACYSAGGHAEAAGKARAEIEKVFATTVGVFHGFSSAEQTRVFEALRLTRCLSFCTATRAAHVSSVSLFMFGCSYRDAVFHADKVKGVFGELEKSVFGLSDHGTAGEGVGDLFGIQLRNIKRQKRCGPEALRRREGTVYDTEGIFVRGSVLFCVDNMDGWPKENSGDFELCFSDVRSTQKREIQEEYREAHRRYSQLYSKRELMDEKDVLSFF